AHGAVLVRDADIASRYFAAVGPRSVGGGPTTSNLREGDEEDQPSRANSGESCVPGLRNHERSSGHICCPLEPKRGSRNFARMLGARMLGGKHPRRATTSQESGLKVEHHRRVNNQYY